MCCASSGSCSTILAKPATSELWRSMGRAEFEHSHLMGTRMGHNYQGTEGASEEEREAVVQMAKRFAHALSQCTAVRLVKVFLIGSYANNTFGRSSDIDLLVVLEEVTRDGLMQIRQLLEVQPFSVKVINTAEYWRMPSRYRLPLSEALIIVGDLRLPPLRHDEIPWQVAERLYRIGARLRRIMLSPPSDRLCRSPEYVRDILKRCIAYCQLKHALQTGYAPSTPEAAFRCAELPVAARRIAEALAVLRSGEDCQTEWQDFVDVVFVFQEAEQKWLDSQAGFHGKATRDAR